MKDRKTSILSVFLAMCLIFLMSSFTVYAVGYETEKTGTVMVQEFLSLRNATSKSAERIKKLSNGENVFITGEEGDFYTIRTQDGSTGYALKRYILLPAEETGKQFLCEVRIDNDSSGTNRNYNMALACTKLDGYRMEPGQQFEWYATVGIANKENGYKIATVISGGKYVDGYGGGVCQVSTALYNAVLKQGLQVDKVFHHSIPSSYVAEGYDATVSWSSDERYRKTLVFTNNAGFPIQIEAFTDGGTVIIRLYQIL